MEHYLSDCNEPGLDCPSNSLDSLSANLTALQGLICSECSYMECSYIFFIDQEFDWNITSNVSIQTTSILSSRTLDSYPMSMFLECSSTIPSQVLKHSHFQFHSFFTPLVHSGTLPKCHICKTCTFVN